MKKIAIAVVAALGCLGVSAANAETPDVNCSALSGTPLMCVKNAAMSPVVAIQAASNNGFNPNGWINIPGGPIMPGGTSIVKFNAWSGGCNQYVSIRTENGTVRTYPGVDVCRSTSFMVRGW